MEWCTCNIAAEFKELAGYGLISAVLHTNANFAVTEGGLVMYGPTMGDLSVTAYAPLNSESLACPGRAGTSFGWMQKIDCDTFDGIMKVYFIPNGVAQAYMEGDVTNQITMHTISIKGSYETFDANASSGPTTPSLRFTHADGYNMVYNGSPIQVTENSGKDNTVVSFFSSILPIGSYLYMNNFSWTYDPPNIPTVSYSFIFSYEY